MSAPDPELMDTERANRLVRDAARYTSVVLLIGRDPDDPWGTFVDEIRNPARELSDALLVRALRELADRIESRS